MLYGFSSCKAQRYVKPQWDAARSSHHILNFSSPRFQDACDQSGGSEPCNFMVRSLPDLDSPNSKSTADNDIQEAWAQVIESLSPKQIQGHRDKTQLANNRPTLTQQHRSSKSRESSRAVATKIQSGEQSVDDILLQAQPNGPQLTSILSRLLGCSEVSRALDVLAWAEKQSYLSSSRAFYYAQLFSGCTKQSQQQTSAKDLYTRVKAAGVLHDVVSYNAMISALGKAGHLRLAQLALVEMQNSGLQPDVYTFTSMIKACQVCGCKWKSGLEYLQAMKAQGIQPNMVTYTVLISCCQRAGQWSAGMRLFRQIEALGLELDIQMANAMVSTCAKGRKWEDAWAITSGIRTMGLLPDTRTYNALISACQRAGQAERALEVFGRMCKEAETRREAEPTLVTFNTLLAACAKAGLYDRSQEVFKALLARSLTPDVYTLSALILACKYQNFWEEAIDIVKTFEVRHKIKLNTIACNTLITTLGRAGRWQYAAQFFQSLKRGELNGRPDEWTYAALVLAYRRGRKYAEVIELFAEMQRKRVPMYKDTYYATLEACERLGLWSDGRAVLQTMQEDKQMPNAQGLDLTAWRTVFAFPPLMDNVPKPIIVAARVAVDSGRKARRLVKTRGRQTGEDTGAR